MARLIDADKLKLIIVDTRDGALMCDDTVCAKHMDIAIKVIDEQPTIECESSGTQLDEILEDKDEQL